MFKKKVKSLGNMPVPQPPKGIHVEYDGGVELLVSYNGGAQIKMSDVEWAAATWLDNFSKPRSMQIKFDKR